MSEAYTVFALVYDELMSQEKYRKWHQLILDVVSEYRIPKGMALDIACGTGTITQMLAEMGFEAIGVDRSEDMLEQARKKLPKIQFVQSDIRNIKLLAEKKALFATSFYDSFNYLLTDRAVFSAFRSVGRYLEPGAIFFFDINSREHTLVSQQNKPKDYVTSDYRVSFHYGGHDRIWELDVLMTNLATNKQYRERHTERGYNREDIEPLLKKAGFDLIKVMEDFKIYEDSRNHLNRLYFVARKK